MCFWRLPFSENWFWQNSHWWGFSFRWTAMMCFWRLPFSENVSWQTPTHKASLSDGLPWCALDAAFLWKSIFTKLLLIRLLFQVDCRYVLLETAFLWKYILAKLLLMKLWCALDALEFSERKFLKPSPPPVFCRMCNLTLRGWPPPEG